MSKIGNIIIGMAFGTSALGINSCSNKTPEPEYPEITKLISEYGADPNEISSNWRKGLIGRCDAQVSLDSVAYRKIFDSTNLAKDSSKVAEFNRIATKNRIPNYIRNDNGLKSYQNRKIRETIQTIEDSERIKATIGSFFANDDSLTVAKKQYALDSVYYSRFFEKHGINDSVTNKKILKTIQKIRP